MNFLIGFLIAVAVGLTGIGGGSFTVPALVLIVGLTAGEAVGTAFVFAGVLRLIAAPFYLLGKRFHGRYLWLLLLGAIPGLLLGTFVLRLIGQEGGNPVVIILLGILLAASSSVTFVPRAQNPGFARKNSRWLPWLALPIGVESGFYTEGEREPGQPAGIFPSETWILGARDERHAGRCGEQDSKEDDDYRIPALLSYQPEHKRA